MSDSGLGNFVRNRDRGVRHRLASRRPGGGCSCRAAATATTGSRAAFPTSLRAPPPPGAGGGDRGDPLAAVRTGRSTWASCRSISRIWPNSTRRAARRPRDPAGRTVTYGAIARRAARRAQGGAGGRPAPGRNPVADRRALCHRVTGAGGRAGGSAPGGTATKLKLLEIEGALAAETLPLFAGRARPVPEPSQGEAKQRAARAAVPVSIVPPCASTMVRQIESPTPSPSALPLWNGSKTRRGRGASEARAAILDRHLDEIGGQGPRSTAGCGVPRHRRSPRPRCGAD